MKTINRIFCSLLLVGACSLGTSAQENQSYFLHTIEKGQSLYSIASMYNISQADIVKLNPGSDDKIYVGRTLRIPRTDAGLQKETFHTIAPGETLYRLTVKYNVSAKAICDANPGLSADNFRIGQVIRIPSATDAAAATADTQALSGMPAGNTTIQAPVQSRCRDMHKVKRKETLYSIARDFNLTEAELKAANPEMNEPGYKLRKGDFVCIPFPKPEKPKEIIPTNEELMGKKAVSAPQKLIRMGVILPFKGGSADNDKMIEFYRGVLMAVEEIKKSGTSVDVFAYDSGKSAGDIKAVVNSHPITNLDFIIGPLYPEQIAPLSKFCQQHHIKLVVPFSSLGDNVYENPYYYAINPPKSYQFAEASRLTTELFGKDNVIFLEGTENDKDAAAFIDATRKRLQQNGSKANRLKLNDDEIKWMEAMTQYKDNVIIPNSSGIKLLNQLFPKLKEFTKKNPEYRIKLVGYPEWQTYASNHLENFYQFNTYAYSSFFRNPLNGNADEFENAYQKAFHTPTLVSWPRFGMLGFDTAIYFLKGISTYGEAFDQHLSQIVTTSYQHRFDFQRISNWSGFINREVEFIHYSPSHSIELIRLKK